MSDDSVYPNALDTQKFFLPAINNLSTSLTATLAVGTTNLCRVVTTAGWPAEGVISIENEIIYYLGLTSTGFTTLIRGFDNTIPTTHNVGALVELRWIAAHHNRMRNAVQTIQEVLGINPQGAFPDVSTRLNALFNSVNSRTNVVPLKRDRATPTKTGYSGGAHLARLFTTSENFVITSNFGPKVHIDGIEQSRSVAVNLVQNASISAITVDNGSGKGLITCPSTTFLSAGIGAGDIVVIKGSPSNDDAYLVDQVISDNQIRVTEVIFGSNQPSSAVGAISIYDIDDATNPIEDFIAVPIVTTDTDVAEGIVFQNPPLALQQVRLDYDIKNAAVSVQYQHPVALLAKYVNPTYTGTVAAGNSTTFTLPIGRSRAIVFATQLSSNGPAHPSNVAVAMFGRADLSQQQYNADFIDLTLGAYIDYGMWHFINLEDVPTTVMNVQITNNSGVAFNFTLTIQCEALGDNTNG